MTSRATLEALLARVLEGTGPDRELDGAAWCAANGFPFVKWDGAGVVWRGADGSIQHYSALRLPPYTASLDVVLRDLLPEGWDWERTPQEDKALVAVFIDIPLPDGSRKSEWIGEIHADDKRALIAACLKARMEAQGE